MKEHRGQSAKADEKLSGRALKNHQTKEETMSLNRKAMALAVGAALAAPGAYAQIKSPTGSDWEFYGKLYPEVLHISGSGATATGTTVATMATAATGTNAIVNRNEMLTGNSYLGFRGKKDLCAGLKGIWQLESQMTFDDATGVLNQADRPGVRGASSAQPRRYA